MYENPFYEPYWVSEEELEHFGIKGMKWGVRRYQNADGTLTEAGKKRYGSAENFNAAREKSKARKQKAVKVAKTAAKVAAIAAVGAVGVSALARPDRVGTVNLGVSAIDQLIRSGALSNKEAAPLLTKALEREGTKSIDIYNWNYKGNPYYKPDNMSKKERELLATVLSYEFDKQKKR